MTNDNSKTLHEWPLSSVQIVRAVIQEFRGRTLLDVRKYYQGDNGDFLPTRKGISLALTPENIGELGKAVRAAKAAIAHDVRNGPDGE